MPSPVTLETDLEWKEKRVVALHEAIKQAATTDILGNTEKLKNWTDELHWLYLEVQERKENEAVFKAGPAAPLGMPASDFVSAVEEASRKQDARGIKIDFHESPLPVKVGDAVDFIDLDGIPCYGTIIRFDEETFDARFHPQVCGIIKEWCAVPLRNITKATRVERDQPKTEIQNGS